MRLSKGQVGGTKSLAFLCATDDSRVCLRNHDGITRGFSREDINLHKTVTVATQAAVYNPGNSKAGAAAMPLLHILLLSFLIASPAMAVDLLGSGTAAPPTVSVGSAKSGMQCIYGANYSICDAGKLRVMSGYFDQSWSTTFDVPLPAACRTLLKGEASYTTSDRVGSDHWSGNYMVLKSSTVMTPVGVMAQGYFCNSQDTYCVQAVSGGKVWKQRTRYSVECIAP